MRCTLPDASNLRLFGERLVPWQKHILVLLDVTLYTTNIMIRLQAHKVGHYMHIAHLVSGITYCVSGSNKFCCKPGQDKSYVKNVKLYVPVSLCTCKVIFKRAFAFLMYKGYLRSPDQNIHVCKPAGTCPDPEN